MFGQYKCTLATSVLTLYAMSALAASAEGVWITHPDTAPNSAVVLHFRRELNLPNSGKPFLVKVSADNRYVLYVNGTRVSAGPARGDLNHWRYAIVDLKPYLHTGANVIAAEVWNAAKAPGKPGLQAAPLAQISARTGFWMEGEGAASVIDSGPHWRVSIDASRKLSSPLSPLIKALKSVWYGAGSAETIDGATQDWQWLGSTETKAAWTNAAPAIDAAMPAPWHLVADALPQMAYTSVEAPKAVRTSSPALSPFPRRHVTVPARSEASVLLDQGTVLSGYPAFSVSGGKGATVTVTYAEALYDDKTLKGDRSDVGNRRAIGITDTFQLDGAADRTFRPLLWRTWRYMDVSVKTSDAAVTLNGVDVKQTGYPFVEKGFFRSNDAQLDSIWEIGWRTLKVDAHETFMDSSYWEQLQYVGDTRIESNIVYAVSGDPRLPVQAIDAFAASQTPDGMIQSAYPSVTDNVIPPFALLWIGMVHDYWMEQPDNSVVDRNLLTMRKILSWYAAYVSPNGLLSRNPGWNFVDWVNDPPIPRDKFPSFDKTSGTSCMTSLIYLGALLQAVDLETARGDKALSISDAGKAVTLKTAIQAQCWDAAHGLYADDPSRTIFSQHTNALAVLYDVAPRDKMSGILDSITRGQGIDAPNGILESSYYFSWYLVRAYEHAGKGDRYLDLLQTWRDLTKLNYTTWPEQRGNTRSDTHAWSAHPTADLIGIVAGIEPAEPGFRAVRIMPHPGTLTTLEAGRATPQGLVKVSFKKSGKGVQFAIKLPKGLLGTLVWRGQTYSLHEGKNRIAITDAY
jgi:alpha-L-rhamnosidase